MASLITSTVLVRGQTMVITAVAGGGKSTVLLAYARAHLTQQFLYLTFNALVRQEKEAEFAAAGVCNVQVETVHSFSRRGVAELEKGATAYLSADATSLLTSLTCSRAADWPRARCQAVLRAFHSFCASDEPAEDEVLTKHASLFSKELLVAEGVKALWQAAAAGNVKVLAQHDVYQKVLQLDWSRRVKAFGPFDFVLLDEAHDCTPAQLDLSLRAGGAQASILVFDVHQKIYAFRGAASTAYFAALADRATVVRSLSCSWRYGEPLAGIVSQVVRALTDDVGTYHRCRKYAFTASH